MQNNQTIKVILADDDEDDRLFFKEALEETKINVEVKMVPDGLALTNFFANNPDYNPHILFLDLNMPIKNGMEVLKELKAHNKWKDFIVAIYSTSNSEKDIEDTFVNGANIYITKPHDFGQLKKVLKEVLSINWQFHTSGLNKDTFLLNI